MPLTSSEDTRDPLALLQLQIEALEKIVRTAGSLALRMNLARRIDGLKHIQKMLASSKGEVKVLIALHGVPHRISKAAVVKATTANLKIFLVDHRLDASRPVEVEVLSKTATDQDFREAVHDEIAGFLDVRSGAPIPSSLFSQIMQHLE